MSFRSIVGCHGITISNTAWEGEYEEQDDADHDCNDDD